jgi:hypothetical protein
MAGTSRVTLPQEFYDKTEDLLLVQPEPQYLYSELFLGAMNASLMADTDFSLPWRDARPAPANIAPYGGPILPAERDQLRLANPLFNEIIAAKVDFTAAPGNTVRINRPSYASTTYTEASRRVPSGSTISTTPITVTSEQANLTLFRYGGPYDQANSRVAPFAIEKFDAQMGVHKLAQIAGNTLVRDFHKFIDSVQSTLLDLAANTIYPLGMTADNDATAAGSYPLTYEQLMRTERSADDLSLPLFSDGFRIAVLTPMQVTQIGLDPLYARQSAYHPLYNQLFPQYVGSISKTHIFKSSTLNTPTNTSSVPVHRGHYIAPGALLGGMGQRPTCVPSTNDNYGQTALVVWLADLAFGLADNRFVLSVRSASDVTASGGV